MYIKMSDNEKYKVEGKLAVNERKTRKHFYAVLLLKILWTT